MNATQHTSSYPMMSNSKALHVSLLVHPSADVADTSASPRCIKLLYMSFMNGGTFCIVLVDEEVRKVRINPLSHRVSTRDMRKFHMCSVVIRKLSLSSLCFKYSELQMPLRVKNISMSAMGIKGVSPPFPNRKMTGTETIQSMGHRTREKKPPHAEAFLKF